MAKQVVDAQQVDFSLLYPLILETAHKATQNDPRQMQTGPAMRGDHNILNMHQRLIGSRAATCTCRSLCAHEPTDFKAASILGHLHMR